MMEKSPQSHYDVQKQALLLGSTLGVIVYLVVLPLGGKCADILIYRGGNAGLLTGLFIAVLIDLAILLSLPFRLRRLKAQEDKREQEQVKL